MWANVWINQDALGCIASNPNDFVAGLLTALQSGRGEGRQTVTCAGVTPVAVVQEVGALEAPSLDRGAQDGASSEISRRE